MTEPAKQMPRYMCHKVVEAVKIVHITPLYSLQKRAGAWILEPSGESFFVSEAYMQKHDPKVGGYYVRYPGSDGYESWSPAKPFEEGYTLIAESEAPDHPGQDVYGWPTSTLTIYCGDCSFAMKSRYMEDVSRHFIPRYECENEKCTRHGHFYELSTAHAVILHEVAQPAALESKP